MAFEFDTVIVHYDEIGIKGNNRGSFENLLMKNIRAKLGNQLAEVKRDAGSIVLELAKDYNAQAVQDALSKMPGIALFSFASKINLNINDIKSFVVSSLKEKNFQTFKIETRRRDKTVPFTSMQLDSIIGQAVVDELDKTAKMVLPDIKVSIEILRNYAFISFGSIEGIGGLPTNPSQKIIALVSGGYDSPVASYLMMKRGCEVIFVHFHNQNQESVSVKDKIHQLAQQLSKFQQRTRLIIVPFAKLQAEIIKNSKAEERMLIYRRFMLRIASRIAEKYKARFLVVGDSFSQVASQTMENLAATYPASSKGILTPLIGMNKREIISLSRKIGAYDISALPYGDCCSFFLPKHPILRADIKQLEQIEANFEIDTLIEDALQNMKIDEF